MVAHTDRGGEAFVRLVVALAFVTGTTAFAGLLIPIVVALVADYVPVLPLAVVVILLLAFAGGIAAAIGAARTWWSFFLGLGFGTIAGLVAAAVGQVLLLSSLQGALAWGVRPFDADAWRQASTSESGYNPRGKMITALLLSRRLDGATADEVVDLLGAPDCRTSEPVERAWQIGLWSGLQLSPDCLHVAFDGDDTVAALRVRRH